MSPVDSAALHGRWVHSHEEDTPEGQVFRRESFPFPPSRGRRSLELRPDGGYDGNVPGPTDRPEETGGTWKLADHTIELHGPGGSTETLQVVSAEPDRLVLRR